MIMKFLRGLGAKTPQAPPAQEPVHYNGFTILPTPRHGEHGWTTEGIISKEMAGETRSQRFIRADTLMSVESAVEHSVTKAKKIIDEQGERLFRTESR